MDQTRISEPLPRLLMIELDSVSLPFVREHAGVLPNLRQFLEDGHLVEPSGPAGLASASVWPTFASARQPGEHGHYFPFQWNARDMSFSRTSKEHWADCIDYEPFWYDLARQGIECVVLDATQVIEHSDAPCLEVLNWSAQSSGRQFASEPAVLGELRRRFGRRPIGPEIPVPKTRRRAEAVRKRSIDAMRKKADAMIWLGTTRKWRFFVGSFQEAHRAGHNLWPSEGAFASDAAPGALLDVYRALDDQISRVVEAISDGDTTIVFFSLNGMKANCAQNHFLPRIMHRLNALYVSGSVPGVGGGNGRGLVAKLREHTPPALQHAAVEMLGENVQDWVVNREWVGSLDWSLTPAFAVPTGGEGLIRLNIKGRERDGYLASDEVGSYVDWLCQRLRAISVKSTGEPLVEDVVMMNDTFPGPRSHFLPDIALTWHPDMPAEEIMSDDIGEVRAELRTGRGGNHTGDSFAIIAGRKPPGTALAQLQNIADYGRFAHDFFHSVPAVQT